MNIHFPVIELIDRYAIAAVKFRRTDGANQDELAFYHAQVATMDISDVLDLVLRLQQVHDEIWDLEKELKSGREDQLSLEEIGRRAIQIRDKNNLRVRLKNTIAEKLGCAVQEIKKDHLSE